MHSDEVDKQDGDSSCFSPTGSITLSVLLGVVVIMVIVGIEGYLIGMRGTSRPSNPKATSAGIPASSLVRKATGPSSEPSPTPTPDPTANWKTYVSTIYNYEMKYPPDWHPHEIKTPSGASEVMFSAPVDNPNPQVTLEDQTLAFQIWRLNNNIRESLGDWATNRLSHPPMKAKRHYILVDGRTALQLEFDNIHSSITAVDVGNYRYLIAADSFSDTYATKAILFDDVISSIHFLPLSGSP